MPFGNSGESNGAFANAFKKLADLTSWTSIAGDGDATGATHAECAPELEADAPHELLTVKEVPDFGAVAAGARVGGVADAMVILEELFVEGAEMGT